MMLIFYALVKLRYGMKAPRVNAGVLQLLLCRVNARHAGTLLSISREQFRQYEISYFAV